MIETGLGQPKQKRQVIRPHKEQSLEGETYQDSGSFFLPLLFVYPCGSTLALLFEGSLHLLQAHGTFQPLRFMQHFFLQVQVFMNPDYRFPGKGIWLAQPSVSSSLWSNQLC